MGDITESLIPNPLYDPLCPSIASLIEYVEEANWEGNSISIEWATHEIKNHLTGFVRAGFVAGIVRRYRLYSRQKFASFKEWCEKVLGRAHWQVKRLIDAARVVVELAQAGFETLPTCVSQCQPLAKFLPKGELSDVGGAVIEKWREVLGVLPPHLITATAIAEVVDDNPKPRKAKITVSQELRDRLSRAAVERGLSTEDLLANLLDELEGESEPDDEEEKETTDDSLTISEADRLYQWHEDLDRLALENPENPAPEIEEGDSS